jgi:hypothetical protein
VPNYKCTFRAEAIFVFISAYVLTTQVSIAFEALLPHKIYITLSVTNSHCHHVFIIGGGKLQTTCTQAPSSVSFTSGFYENLTWFVSGVKTDIVSSEKFVCFIK